MILAALACPVFNSCADFSTDIENLKGDIENLEDRVAALETRLNDEISALKTLLEGKINALEGKVDGLVTVSKCEKDGDNYKVTLSDGSSFTVYPEYKEDLTGLVTTTEIGGVLYWAVYEDGKPVVVTDKAGSPVPVVDVVPQVRVDAETGYVEISFDGGSEWIGVGYDEPCVFTDVEIVYTDNYTDEEEQEYPEYNYETPMYVVLTLPDGSTISVTIDGTASFIFASNYGGMIKTQYIKAGGTTAIPVQAVNIVDWVKEVPAGWKVVEDTQYLAEYGQAEFHVTAPSAEAIASGAAVAEGTLKVLAVAEGGKSVTASVNLTVKAFSELSAGKGNLTVSMNSGLGGYLVGITPKAEFDGDAIIAELKPIVEYVPDPNDWSDYGWSPWYVEENSTPLDDNYFDGSLEEYPIADLKKTFELVPGEQYVVWAIGLDNWVNQATWESGYYLGDIVSVDYLNASVNLETTLLAFNEIQISAEFVGMTAFYGAFSMKYNDDDIRSGLVSELNSSLNSSWGAPMPIYVNDEYVDGWNNGVYTGDPNTLVSGWQSVGPGETYYLYIIPYVEGKTRYTVSDMYYYEWTTDPLLPGGTATVTAGEAIVDYKKIAVPLTAEGAVYMYYKYVEPAMIPTIADKQAYLLENGMMADGGSVTANIANIQPSTTMTLIAMAVDQYGCYGDVFQQDYTSKAMEYASATVTAEVSGQPSQTGYVKISCTGDVDTYYYWYGAKEDYQWSNPSYFGGSVESASAFIALTPNSYLLTKLTPAEVPADGILMEGLTIGSPSVFVVSAKLADGTFTMAAVAEFTPALDLGDFVYATDDNGNENPAWVAAKPTVTYSIESIGDFTNVSWSVTLPEGFSGRTSCVGEDYLFDYPSAKNKVEFFLSYPYIDAYDVVAGETYSQPHASRGYNIYTVIWDAEGNYYETYVEKLNISGGFGV